MNTLAKRLSKELRLLAERIDNGTSELTDEESMDLLSAITHKSMSKDQAYSYLNMSRSLFDSLVRSGKMPEGRKVRGYKELRRYQDELDKYKMNFNGCK